LLLVRGGAPLSSRRPANLSAAWRYSRRIPTTTQFRSDPWESADSWRWPDSSPRARP
jgi:hypothetical protein